MLKQRIITALVLLPLMVGAIFYLSGAAFAVAMAIPVLAAAWEWTNLMGFQGQVKGHLFVALIALLLALVHAADARWVVIPGALWWVFALVIVRQYPEGTASWASLPRMTIIGVLLLVPAWEGILYLHSLQHGNAWLLYAMCLVWGADSGAYFAGRRFGKHKLAPAVSPGKTLEGLVGGLLLTTLIAVGVLAWAEPAQAWSASGFLFISAVTVLASVLGDLFESMAKRHRGIKDSSQLLPGHGGVLDRIDSVTAAIPVFVTGLLLLQG